MKKTILHLLIGCFSVFQAQILHAQQTNVDSLQRLLKNTKIDTLKIKIYVSLYGHYSDSNLDSALYYVKKADELSQKNNYKTYFYQINTGYTLYYMYNNDLKKAIEYTKKSEKWAKETNNQKRLAASYNNFVAIYNQFGQYRSAVEYGHKALDLTYKMKDSTVLATRYINISQTYHNLRQFDKSILYGKKAIEFGNKYKLDYEIIAGTINSANGYSAQNKLNISIPLYERALELSKKKNVQRGVITALVNLTHNNYKNGNKSEVKKYVGEFNNLIKDIEDKSTLIEGKNLNALMYLMEGAYDKAKLELTKSIKLTEKEQDKTALGNIYQTFSKLYYLQGDIKEGEKYVFKADSLRDADFLEELNFFSNELETKYQTEKKEAQIKVQEAELKQKTTNNILLIGGIIALSLVSLLVFLNYRNRIKLKTNEITALQKEKQLTATESIIKGQEEERSRLAKDLHDGLGGILSSLKYSLTSMTGNFILTENSGRTFTKALETLETAISEMRRVAHSMMPEALLKFGLNDAILNFCEGINQHGKLQINFQAYGLENRLEQSVEITIFRIVQELLNNAMKHSEASKVLVQLTKTNETLVLTVEDNGKGFEKKLLEQNKGAGISNIESRVSYLNGQIEIDSNAATGTSIIIEIPIKKV